MGEKSIVEKLGIAKGYYISEGTYYIGTNNAVFVESKEMKQIKDTSLDLLDVLIAFVSVNDEPCRKDHHGYCQTHFLEENCMVDKAKKIIEKACKPLTWEQIKEIIK